MHQVRMPFPRARGLCVLMALCLPVATGCGQGEAPGDEPSPDEMPVGDAGTPNPDPEPEPDPTPEPAPEDPYGLTVSGSVVSLVDGSPVEGSVSVAAAGLNPPPTIRTTGAEFVIEGVPAYGTFHLLAGSIPGYRTTYGQAIEIGGESLEEVYVRTISETRLADLSGAFGVTPSPGTAIVLAKLVGEDGEPAAGVALDAITLYNAPAARGPYALNDDYTAYPGATETQAGGWIVFFDVPSGSAEVRGAPESGYEFEGTAPTEANVVSLMEVSVYGEPPPPVVDVSFSDDVVPVFERRGCTACHSGGGIGREEGGLTLSGGVNVIHRELTEELSPNQNIVRVDVDNPEASLLLTMPLFEDPPDTHPAAVFPNNYDPDYLILLGWILEGAQNN